MSAGEISLPTRGTLPADIFHYWGQSPRVSVLEKLINAILWETIPLRQSLRALQQGHLNDKNAPKSQLEMLVEQARICSMFALKAGLLKWGRDLPYLPKFSNLFFSINEVLLLLSSALMAPTSENALSCKLALHYSQRLSYHLESLSDLLDDIDFHQQLPAFHQSRTELHQAVKETPLLMSPFYRKGYPDE